MYQLKENDIHRLITACKHYQNETGSEFIWAEYQDLVDKLKLYVEQNLSQS